MAAPLVFTLQGDPAITATTAHDERDEFTQDTTRERWTVQRTITGTIALDLGGQPVSGDLTFTHWSSGAWTMDVGNDGQGSCEAFAYFRAGDLYTGDAVLVTLFETLAGAAAMRSDTDG